MSGRKTNPVLFFMVFIGTSIPPLLDMVCGNTSFDIRLMTSKRMKVTSSDVLPHIKNNLPTVRGIHPSPIMYNVIKTLNSMVTRQGHPF